VNKKERQQVATAVKGRSSKKAKTTIVSKIPAEGGSSKFQSLFSNRAEGFMIELNFRNAPPRPPVGPCFVGLGFEGMLNKWTKYRPFNAVETGYAWKLHSEPDLGVPLAPAAMNLKCYRDPTEDGKNSNKRKKLPPGYEDDEDEDEQNGQFKGPPALHPDDEALIQWKGSLGDSSAEHLQIRRDRARAEARALSQGKAIPTPTKSKSSAYRNDRNTSLKNPNSSRKALNTKSRVLSEAPQSWMRQTTYISNDGSRKVHDFTSATTIKKRSAMEVDKKMEETKAKLYDPETIEAGFQTAKNTKTRKHPTKRNVTPLYDYPLLPDVDTWGYTYTHVVLDKPPKIDSSSKKDQKAESSLLDRIAKAFITDVEKREQNSKMVCKLLAPEHNDHMAAISKSEDDEGDQQEDHQVKNYEVTQTYDLDVTPLKDEKTPHINFLLIIDEEKGIVRYHPVSSKVQLSTGRPSEPDKSIIEKRTLGESDVQDFKIRTAEVDIDLEKQVVGDEDFGEDNDDDEEEEEHEKDNNKNKDDDDEEEEDDDFDGF